MKARTLHYICHIAFALLALVSCGKNRNLYSVEGVISAESGDSIFVVGFDSRFSRCDTIRPTAGVFHYSVRVDTITPLLLLYSNGGHDILFAEKGTTAHLRREEGAKYAVVNGGDTDNLLTSFRKRCGANISLDSLMQVIDSITIKHPFSEALPYIIYEYLIRDHDASISQINSIRNKMGGVLQDHQFMLDLGTEIRRRGGSHNTYLSNIMLTDTAGIEHNFNDLCNRGYQIATIWASWNEESRRGRDSIYSIREDFPDKQIIFTSISLDMNRERWIESVASDSLDWVEYCNPLGYNSKFISTTGIYQIPSYILLSAQESIIKVCYSIDEVKKNINLRVPTKKE